MRGIAAVATLTLACSSEGLAPLPLPVRFETQHFRYRADPEQWICPGFDAWLEHDYASRTAWLGVALPDGEKLDYHFLRDRTAVGEHCGAPHGEIPSGCVVGSNVYTADALHSHELAHAYAVLLPGGGPPLFFNEGLAVVLGGGNGGAVDRSMPVESLVETDVYRSVMEPEFAKTYPLAGAFTRFLLDRHGREAYLSFYTSVPQAASGAEIRAAFQLAFAETLEAALAEWRAGPQPTEAGSRLYLSECGAPALEEPVASFSALSCDTMATFRPLSLVRSFSVAEAAGVVLRLRTSRVTSARLEACAGELHPERALLTFEAADLGTTRELWTDLTPGEYWLQVSADGESGEESAEVSISIERGPPLLADHCDAAAGRSVAPDTREIVFAGLLAGASDDEPADGLADVSATFRLAEARMTDTTSFTPSDIEQAKLCVASCPGDPAPDCLADVGGATAAADVPHTLTLAGTPGDDGYRYGLQLGSPE